MFHLLFRGILMGVSLWLSIKYLDGIELVPENPDEMIEAFIITTFFITFAELLAYPIVNAFILPLRAFTLGLASLFVSVLLIYFVSSFYAPFEIGSFVNALFLAIVFAIIRFGTDEG